MMAMYRAITPSRRGRGSASGLPSGSFSGSFQGSSLPGFGGSHSISQSARSDHETSEDTSTSGLTVPPRITGSAFNVSDSTELVSALNSVMNVCKATQEQVKRVELKIGTMEQQQSQLSATLKELQTLVKKQVKESFSVKGSNLEAPLRAEMAKLFCGSLTRYPLEASINSAIVKVLGKVGSREKYKVEVAFKYCKAKLTEYRTEERRKVLGHKPYDSACFLPTAELAQQIMRQVHAPDDTDEELYIKHLAVLRRYVRECYSETEVKYTYFKEWMGECNVTEDMWDKVMADDESFDYHANGAGLVPGVALEVDATTQQPLPPPYDDNPNRDEYNDDPESP